MHSVRGVFVGEGAFYLPPQAPIFTRTFCSRPRFEAYAPDGELSANACRSENGIWDSENGMSNSECRFENLRELSESSEN